MIEFIIGFIIGYVVSRLIIAIGDVIVSVHKYTPVSYYNADKEAEHLRCTCSPVDYHAEIKALIQSRSLS